MGSRTGIRNRVFISFDVPFSWDRTLQMCLFYECLIPIHPIYPTKVLNVVHLGTHSDGVVALSVSNVALRVSRALEVSKHNLRPSQPPHSHRF